ncbi:MAG: hypothetical protein IPK64_21740 [bacterium]|nr:hypothetical protein [bacterium]
MELWKIEKFCETAALEQLRAIEERLDTMVDAGLLTGTNALIALQKVREAIALRELFGER